MATQEMPRAASAGEPAHVTHSRSESLDFFRRAMDAATRAEAVADSIDRFISLGGETVRLRFSVGSLQSYVMPALDHLSASPTGAPALTVHIWDSASTGVQMPRPAWRTEAVEFRGDVQGFNDDRISTAFQADASLLSIFDSESNEAVYWIRNSADIPFYEQAAPLLRIFHWWFRQRGMQVVHAAAVGTSSGGVLIAGKGGAGKSNTALACVKAGLGYASDDYCVLSPGEVPQVWSLYNSGKTRTEDVERLPFLAPLIANPNRGTDEKALYFLQRGMAARLIRNFPLRAILLPRITGEVETRLQPASPSAGVLSLSPSTVSQLPGSSRDAVATIARVCRKVPVYHLELGTDRNQIPRVISALLASA
jgi:hypothetical protein